jgi:succinylglutamate desuccinylase
VRDAGLRGELDARVIRALLERFVESAAPGFLGYPWAYHHPGHGGHTRHVLIGCAIHGNEHGTLPAACEFVELLKSGTVQNQGPVTVLLGNTEAALADKRFLEEDFNRVFTFDRPAQSLERRLAERVRPILDVADVFLDLHQTQTPTERPFWTFPWSSELGDWARVLELADAVLTRKAGQAFSPGTCCLDEYVRARGRVGITAELGMRGQDVLQQRAALKGMLRLVEVVDRLAAGASLPQLAEQSAAVRHFATRQVVKTLTQGHRLKPGLCNWTAVTEGEILSAPDSPRIVAESAGYVMFPKYPEAGEVAPPELCRIAGEVRDLAELDR